jgi:hypothetical protein
MMATDCQCLYLLSEWTQLVEHYAFLYHLLHVSAIVAIINYKQPKFVEFNVLIVKGKPPPCDSFPYMLLWYLPDGGQKWLKHVVDNKRMASVLRVVFALTNKDTDWKHKMMIPKFTAC